jgi:nicotinate dehydrogenase subunit B
MAASHAPVPWTEADLFDYLRTGFSPLHGVAAGPMAPVVAGLARVPEAEVRAMAHYLASFQPRITQEQAEALAAGLEARASSAMPELDAQGASIYEGACAACHDASASPGFGVRPALALNTNLHAARPDNVLRVLLDGASPPGEAAHGAMPAFRNSLDDRQMASLLGYLRARFAADQPAWSGLEKAAARLRAETAPS